MSTQSTPQFDSSKAYKQKGATTYFNDGREIELLHFIYGLDIDKIRGSPAAVVASIDEFARTQKYLMNVGAMKGKIICDLIEEVKPKTMVELGGYIGYSSILFGDAFRRAGGKRYYVLEHNAEFAAVITSLLDLAGLSDTVKVVVGGSDHSLKRLHSEEVLEHVDLLFIDHTAFERDLKLCEELRLIAPGSVIAADNCIYPGHPEYTSYVRSNVTEKRAAAKQTQGGNPNLVYDSNIIHSFEPSGEKDGVEITRCIREDA